MASPPSPKDSGFVPRREFIRDPKPPPNSFSLLAISGSSSIRLYSFTPSIVNSLRAFFRQASLLHTYREDLNNQFFEFTLEGKPWSSPKSVATERLLIEILSVISHHGYQFLSTVDYGRESDDRVALTFSRPAVFSQSLSPSPTPIPPSNGSGTTLSGKQRSYPFALSFSSMTCLRVICPPLHSTPAILQAVRGAWPRGVESEKKIGENCFEFKLKGYKWFHEDTFATDSLRHILALLSSLDSHSFELQTSISLTNSRSRVKDLWIFTGPPSVDDFLRDSPSPSILHSSPEIMRPTISPDPFAPPNSAAQVHRRLVTEPLSSPRPASPLRHGRALTEDPQTHGEINPNVSHAMPHNVLRKPAPRAQVPMSVHDDGENAETEEYRALLPSTIPSGVENMTGVGAATPDVFYSTPAFGTQAVEGQRNMRTPSPNGYDQPIEQSPLAPEELEPSVDVPNTQSLSGPLLSPGAFRDSALSTTTDVSAVIPIKWTGLAVDGNDGNGRIPSTPMFPGGWQPTPVEEKDEQRATDAPLDIQLDQDKEPEEPVQDVRVASPEIMNGEIRQSEAGLIVTAAAPPPPSEAQEREMPENQEQRQTTASSGQGWVMVNVEQPSQSDDTPPLETVAAQDTMPSVNTENKVSDASSPVPPAAKAIVIVDAIESKKPKSKDPQSSSRIKRFLSLTRRDSSKEADAKTTHSRTVSMGQKLRQIGTPEATRNDEKRRSFD